MSINSTWAARGMVVAPHSLAAQSGLAVLREGGNALEAMVAAAATISVVYPHMNGIGGDSFWVIHEPGKPVITIDACGRSAGRATVDFYRQHQVDAIPMRGPLATNTVAGTISGWALALDYSKNNWAGRLPLARLLDDATHCAEHGIVVTKSQHANTAAKLAELKDVPGFGERFLVDGRVPDAGSMLKQTKLAATMRQLAKYGLGDFYEGELARSIAGDLAQLGSPLLLADFGGHSAELRAPVMLKHSLGTLYNMAPPTQGTASLMILGILDRLGLDLDLPGPALGLPGPDLGLPGPDLGLPGPDLGLPGPDLGLGLGLDIGLGLGIDLGLPDASDVRKPSCNRFLKVGTRLLDRLRRQSLCSLRCTVDNRCSCTRPLDAAHAARSRHHCFHNATRFQPDAWSPVTAFV